MISSFISFSLSLCVRIFWIFCDSLFHLWAVSECKILKNFFIVIIFNMYFLLDMLVLLRLSATRCVLSIYPTKYMGSMRLQNKCDSSFVVVLAVACAHRNIISVRHTIVTSHYDFVFVCINHWNCIPRSKQRPNQPKKKNTVKRIWKITKIDCAYTVENILSAMESFIYL